MDRFGQRFDLRSAAKAELARSAAPLPIPASAAMIQSSVALNPAPDASPPSVPSPSTSFTTAPQTLAPQSPALRLEPMVLAAPVAEAPEDWAVGRRVVFTIALGIAIVAGYFSVGGMSRLFPGAFWPVIAMATLMELGKVGGAWWLSHQWRELGVVLRGVLTFLIATLALINAVGVFGQLTAAHLAPHRVAVSSIAEKAAGANAEIDAKQKEITDLTKRIDQIDAMTDEATKRGRFDKAAEISRLQKDGRAHLVEDRNAREKELIELRRAQASVAGERAQADGDVGVLQYAADLFRVDREWIMQLLILAMTWSCDPLSITLVIATAGRKRRT